MVAQPVQLAIGEEVTSDDVEDAARAARFRLVNLVPAGAEHPAQAIFTRDAGTTVLYFLQGSAERRLVLTGDGAERAAADLRRALEEAPRSPP